MPRGIQNSYSLSEIISVNRARRVVNVDKAQFAVRVGEHIERLREKSGMNISEFLEAVGISKAHTYSRIRSGDNAPSLYVFAQMVRVLGPELLEVFGDGDHLDP